MSQFDIQRLIQTIYDSLCCLPFAQDEKLTDVSRGEVHSCTAYEETRKPAQMTHRLERIIHLVHINVTLVFEMMKSSSNS